MAGDCNGYGWRDYGDLSAAGRCDPADWIDQLSGGGERDVGGNDHPEKISGAG